MRCTRRVRSVARGTLIGLAVGLVGLPALAQPAANGPIWNGQQHQPTRGTTGERAQDGASSGAEPRGNQLRDLNALSRQLAPGTPVPAPEVERGAPDRR